MKKDKDLYDVSRLGFQYANSRKSPEVLDPEKLNKMKERLETVKSKLNTGLDGFQKDKENFLKKKGDY